MRTFNDASVSASEESKLFLAERRVKTIIRRSDVGERFYRQRDKLTMNNQPIPPAQRRPKGTVPTYYEQLRLQKAKVEKPK